MKLEDSAVQLVTKATKMMKKMKKEQIKWITQTDSEIQELSFKFHRNNALLRQLINC